jgi:gamma-glutamyltranspeptidase / glutathione hydrolase
MASALSRCQPQPGQRIGGWTTLPTLVLKDHVPALAISVAERDLRDRVALKLLVDCIDFGLEPSDAVTAPRFATYHHQGSFDPKLVREQTFIGAGSLTINDSISDDVQTALTQREYQTEVKRGTIADPVMLHRDPETGTYRAVGDPGAGRHAADVSE